ncbi:MAG: hypothetical protein QOG79_2884 [Mycobacterium sp.]|jgi:hypothetical protein|nr:hypothetical protein [Mycobacterium sp.]MDT5299642.1 hypothetical protein [Mycobacterium sp.]
MPRIVEPYPLDTEPVEHPAPTEREQIWVIGLSELLCAWLARRHTVRTTLNSGPSDAIASAGNLYGAGWKFYS